VLTEKMVLINTDQRDEYILTDFYWPFTIWISSQESKHI